MAKPRSPVLGFNHNVRHAGWLFHVQTEDSGVSNPHIFTHLFHDGVILASKKMVYDADSAVDIVKGLMQAQHKSVLRELKSGLFDAKIKQYLGDAPRAGSESDYDEVTVEADRTPTPTSASSAPITVGAVGDLTEPMSAPPPQEPSASPADVSAAFRAISHASAQMTAVRTPGSTNPPPLAPDAAAQPMVFPPPAAPPPPPGSGVWSGKPEITQERPFDRSGSFPAMSADAAGRPSGGPGTEPPGGARGKAGSSGKQPTGPNERRPPTAPPGGVIERGPHQSAPAATPAPRPASVPVSRPADAGSAPASARGSGPATNRPAGAPPVKPATTPPVGAPATLKPTVSGIGRPVAPPSGTAGGPRPTGPPPIPAGAAARPSMPAGQGTAPRAPATPGTSPPVRPVPPARAAGSTPGTVPPPTGATGRPVQGSPNVIVARPAVIVGAPPQIVGGGTPRRVGTGPREALPPPAADSIFGKDLISEKSLDEVIMAYLSEDANEE